MREIKFRGKDKNKNWVYGDLIHGVGASGGDIFILPIAINLAYIPNCDPIDGVWVDEDTIGQFTGMKDLKSSDIYEGDLLKDLNGVVYEVWYSEDKACYMAEMKNPKNDMVDILGGYDTNDFFEVIGNIYDNKGLITKE